MKGTLREANFPKKKNHTSTCNVFHWLEFLIPEFFQNRRFREFRRAKLPEYSEREHPSLSLLIQIFFAVLVCT